ncbi:MAG: DHCW motif cupin fold protein, partial [Calditrichaeota bacterium]|nr:DHCW motif cupin fold protein [Calditrichota bacterium]
MSLHIPFTTLDWDKIAGIDYPGEQGTAIWQTTQFSGLRLRIVEYSKGYFANHWCEKGHIVHCLEGDFISE